MDVLILGHFSDSVAGTTGVNGALKAFARQA